MSYYVYLITNHKTNKVYVGRTNNPYKRWKSHQSAKVWNKSNGFYLYNSMRKHGIENFSFHILEVVQTFQESVKREIYYISKYDSFNAGYNMTPGGEGCSGYIMSDAAKQKIRNARIGTRLGEDNPACKTRKRYRATLISGEVIEGVGIKKLCREREYNHGGLSLLRHKKLNRYKDLIAFEILA